MHLGAKQFPKNTILIRIRNCLLANTVFRFWRKKEWSKYLFKEDRLPYDVNMTWRCRQTIHSFTFSLLFGVRSEKRRKNQKCHTQNRRGGDGGVWNRVGLEWRGLGKRESRVSPPSRPGSRLTWHPEENLFKHKENDQAMKTNFLGKPPHSQKH